MYNKAQEQGGLAKKIHGDRGIYFEPGSLNALNGRM